MTSRDDVALPNRVFLLCRLPDKLRTKKKAAAARLTFNSAIDTSGFFHIIIAFYIDLESGGVGAELAIDEGTQVSRLLIPFMSILLPAHDFHSFRKLHSCDKAECRGDYLFKLSTVYAMAKANSP